MIAPPIGRTASNIEFDEFTIIMRGKNSLKLMGIGGFRSWTKHFNPKGAEFVTATLSKKNANI